MSILELTKTFRDSLHIMVDLETVDSRSTSAISQISAVAFRPGDVPGTFLREFNSYVDIQSCEAVGLTISASTIKWWFKQTDEAIKAVFGQPDTVTIRQALRDFSVFCGYGEGGPSERLWGHGATFDNVILDNAYRACDERSPVSFRGARDTRTLFDLVGGGDWSEEVSEGVTMSGYGPKHDALADAKRQAIVVQRAISALTGG